MASKESLVLDYYHTTLYPSEYEKTVSNGGYIKMPYIHSKGPGPNLVYNGRKYATSQLYITKVSDNEGELVIKHVPTTNGENPVYLIIPLKTRPTTYEETPIDKIINGNGKSPISFHLGEWIGYNKTASVNKEGTLFKLSPILVKSSFDTFVEKKMEWANNATDDFRKINLLMSNANKDAVKKEDVDGVEGFSVKNTNIIEGATDATEAGVLTCEPILENDGKAKETVEYMPVTSELAKKMGTMNAVSTVVNFMIFILVIIVATFITPTLYKTLFVDYIVNLNVPSPANKYASLISLDYLGFIVLLAFAVGLATTGASMNDALQTMIGALMSIALIVCTAVITYFKMTNPGEYSLTEGIGGDVKKVGWWENGMLGSEIWNRVRHGWGPQGLAVGVGSCTLIGTLLYFFKRFDKNKKKDKSKKNVVLSYFIGFGTLVSIYLVARLNKIEPSGRVAPMRA